MDFFRIVSRVNKRVVSMSENFRYGKYVVSCGILCRPDTLWNYRSGGASDDTAVKLQPMYHAFQSRELIIKVICFVFMANRCN